MKSIFGKKLGMTRLFDESGRQTPVTAIEVGPCVVVQTDRAPRKGVATIQIGYGTQKPQRLSKAVVGHYAKAGVEPCRMLREVAVEDGEEVKVGDTITASIFEETKYVDIIGVTKGRGFQGVVKRHGMSGGPKTHGSHMHREVGSIGQCTRPSRVFKNKKMPGQMGNTRTTMQNLQLVKVLADENVILVKGAVPGPTGAIVEVRKALKKS